MDGRPIFPRPRRCRVVEVFLALHRLVCAIDDFSTVDTFSLDEMLA